MPITFRDGEGKPLVKDAFYYDLNNCNLERSILYETPLYQLVECEDGITLYEEGGYSVRIMHRGHGHEIEKMETLASSLHKATRDQIEERLKILKTRYSWVEEQLTENTLNL